ncbi:MAG: GGDEF domain-containing protein [Rhodospirillales bacterium]
MTLAKISVSAALGVLFALVLTLGTFSVGATILYVRNNVVLEEAVHEAERVADLVRQNLYDVMLEGRSDELSGIVLQTSQALPDARIEVYRSQAVVDLFGDTPDAKAAREVDTEIGEVFRTGKERRKSTESSIRFYYPIKVVEACTSCHVNTKPGDLNGVIYVEYFHERLSSHLLSLLEVTVANFVTVVAILFLILFLGIRFLVTKPVADLVQHIEERGQEGFDHGQPLKYGYGLLRDFHRLTDNFNHLMSSLAESHRTLENQAVRDALTGALNRRSFNERLVGEVERSVRYDEPFSVVMIDLDGFKAVNDTFGHAAGDFVLKAVTDILGENIRASDTAFRLGGDEFAIIAPKTTADNAKVLTEHLRKRIDHADLIYEQQTLLIGASMGTATFGADTATVDDLLATADSRMYADKQARKAAKAATS